MDTHTPLTAIERQLLQALSQGASNKHMARDMSKSEFTIRNQLSDLFAKISVNNRTHAALWYQAYLAHAGNGTSVLLPAPRNTTTISTQALVQRNARTLQVRPLARQDQDH